MDTDIILDLSNLIRYKNQNDRKSCIRELREGYKARKKEDRQLALEWDTTSGDGID